MFKLDAGPRENRFIRAKQSPLSQVLQKVFEDCSFAVLRVFVKQIQIGGKGFEPTSSYVTRTCSTKVSSVIPVIDICHIDV